MIVLDASVIVKFSEEEYTEKTLEIREKVRKRGILFIINDNMVSQEVR